MHNDLHSFPVRVVTKCVVSCFKGPPEGRNEQILEVDFVDVFTCFFALFDTLRCESRVDEFIVAIHLEPTLQRESIFC